MEIAPARALGDLAVTLAFQLARTLRKPPRAIAQELSGALGDIAGIARVVATPNGYLNLYLDRRSFAAERVANRLVPSVSGAARTIVPSPHTPIGKRAGIVRGVGREFCGCRPVCFDNELRERAIGHRPLVDPETCDSRSPLWRFLWVVSVRSH